jgi:hypothetical protein
MRCWVFDWQGRQYQPPVLPGRRPPFLPDLTLDVPGRRWVFDDPDGSGVVWAVAASRLAGDAVRIIDASQAPPDDAAVLRAIDARWTGSVVVRTRPPGERHPRIWRGGYSEPPESELNAFADALTSASVLLDRFRHILRTLEPDPANRQSFGHELRQLLILTSTEVESAWKSILVANGYRPPKERRGNSPNEDRFNTNDYCKLRDPLRLEKWEIAMTTFPRYGNIAPFRGWDSAKPTASLGWYDDYNSTKHDREVNLRKATLENVISAVAALYVMLAAQVGPTVISESPYAIPDFRPVHQPEWSLAEEYVPAFYSTSLVNQNFGP